MNACLFNTDNQSLNDSQSKFQMFTLFFGRRIGAPQRCTTWRFYTGLRKFLRNISRNICSLVKHTDPKLGEVSSLFTSYKITISSLYPLNGLRFIFYCVTVKTINNPLLPYCIYVEDNIAVKLV